MIFAMLAGGFIGLVLGGELLIRGAVGIARRLGVSPLVIGITLVGFGTSAPELVTCIQAALVGAPGLALGNVVGSNTANILLILGLAAIVRPVHASPEAFRRDGSALVVASLLCLGVMMLGIFDRIAGAFFVLALAAYLIATYLHDRQNSNSNAETADETGQSFVLLGALVVGGLILTIAGARLLVEGAIDLAQALGVSETIIGLTIVAIGTSLPEVVTSVVAAWRGHSDVAFGNVVGSCIYNLLGILGITAMVKPIPVPIEIAHFDIWVMLAATAALVVATMTGWRVTRLEGMALLGGYIAYLGYLGMNATAWA
ncbi:MAG: calcium/sodium antiporter [Pseudomonadota bacterium]